MKIRWIDGNSNLADAMTRAQLCAALQKPINNNIISLNAAEWVKRAN